MKSPTSKPLSEAELDFLEDVLSISDHDNAIMSVSELDGFLTAIVSGPNMVQPSQWLPELWGGSSPSPGWEDEAEMQRFISLVVQHMNSIVTALMAKPKYYVPLFNTDAQSDELILIVEDWCVGYMRGVDLGYWPILPEEMDSFLYAIALHGSEAHYDLLDTLTQEEHQETAMQIGSAVLKLHQYYLAQRSPSPSSRPTIVRSGPKVGRNDPCPCGSGKKFKQCCLH
jgi:uncharacterized protein